MRGIAGVTILIFLIFNVHDFQVENLGLLFSPASVICLCAYLDTSVICAYLDPEASASVAGSRGVTMLLLLRPHPPHPNPNPKMTMICA